jgi:hypothetical protein
MLSYMIQVETSKEISKWEILEKEVHSHQKDQRISNRHQIRILI